MRRRIDCTGGLSVRIAAFISALLLSLLCGMFYNLWKYEIERITLEEGGWHSRLIGEFSPEEIERIKNFANIQDVAVNEKEDPEAAPSADLYFSRKRAVFSDTPRIARQLGLTKEQIVYHYELLALYLIRGAGDPAPRLLFPLFLLILLAAIFSLIVMIHHAFAVSMTAKVRQVGILSSIGATPRQIRTGLLREAAALCAAEVLAGDLLGIAGCAGLLHLTNVLLAEGVSGRHEAVFGYHPLVLALTLLATAITIGISADLPARRLSRLTPLEAIRNTGEYQLRRKKKSRLLAWLLGLEGELAGNALRAQRKALRTASVSFVSAFLAFAMMQCFFTLSQISTEETYFERYQDVWDVMVTLKGAGAGRCEAAEAVRSLKGVKSAVLYQKAKAKRLVTEEEMSGGMKSFGGFSQAPQEAVTQTEDGWLVNAPIVILDDRSFLDYCGQIGAAARLDGAVILNRIRDVTNPDFRHPDLMPYINVPDAANAVSALRAPESGAAAGVCVLAYTDQVPALREEYATLDYYELVHFLPASLWEKLREQIGGGEEESYLCVKAEEGAAPSELNTLQEEIGRVVGEDHIAASENRIQEYETNRTQIWGMRAFFGGFCALIALIGAGGVFSNTLGFVRQRRREFARYMSVGMTPRQLRKMFCTEALVIAGRPVFIGLPVVAAAVGAMLRASYIKAGEFLEKAPYRPILLFLLAILASVALAYFLAWRSIQRISLAEVLKEDTML